MANQLPAINIGQYTRPDIYIQEYDQSIVTSPTFQGITNLVIGVSKQGPVNAPILLQNINDLQNTFGPIDRSLERNGSFFQRTIAQMLQSSPVYAMNLLATNDALDLLQYQELSCATSFNNDILRTAPYRLFYDTKGFWTLKNTDPFIELTETQNGGQPLPYYNTDMLNITNFSSQYVTVFIYHTQLTTYNQTMLQYYGSVQAMPLYVNQQDWASDYMVDIVAVAGNWTNYNNLSIDPVYGQFFNNTGLIKSQVTNFVNNSNVSPSVLAYYQGVSLIPYFRDINGKNIFIEQIVNADTSQTGLYCAFNMDLYETTYPNGLVDLIGNNIAGTTAKSINFLSYNQTIINTLPFANTYLDAPGNVVALSSFTRNGNYGPNTRTGYYAEGIVNGVRRDSGSFAVGTSSVTVQYDVNYVSINGGTTFIPAYSVVGGNLITVSGTNSFTINASSYPNVSTTYSYVSAFALNTSGSIYVANSYQPSVSPSIALTDVALGYFTLTVYNGSFVTSSTIFTDVTVNTSGFADLAYGPSGDYYTTYLGTGSIAVTFNNTAATPNVANYQQYRRFKMFNAMLNLLDSPNVNQSTMVWATASYTKISTAGMTLSNVNTSSTANLSFNLSTGLTSSQIYGITGNGMLEFYDVDNEFVIGKNNLVTTNSVAPNGLAYGVVAQYSEFYQSFYDGDIITGDYFYDNRLGGFTFSANFAKVSGNNYFVLSATPSFSGWIPFAIDDVISVPQSVLNTGTYTMYQSVSNPASIGFTGSYAWQVVESVVNESLSSINTINAISDTSNLGQHYLQMYTDQYNNLNVLFTDSTLTSPFPIYNTLLDPSLNVVSEDSNYKETVEVIIPSTYTPTPNSILCNADRYANISIGDFLSAYVNPSTLVSGQQPRNLTRVLSKSLWTGTYSNANGTVIPLVQITCDSQILIATYSNSYYETTRYTLIDDYVTTYKGIPLYGFRVRAASLPDGTDATQNTILNLVAKGTPLFNALTNKDAFDFRYLIDSFGLGLISQSKQQLMDICGARLNCLGFLNMPSMKQFQQSSSPSFVDQNGVLQTSFIAQGGNPNSSPAFLYSFGTGIGVSTVGYFCPYLTISDNGRPWNVPPAMFVASTYMNKFNTNVSSIVPWTIAAGITNGRIQGIAGVEMDFTPQDISNLNLAQMNPIVMKRNRGYVIETENTALTLYKSSLSFLHSREVLIELENALYDMLLNFQWKFNTQDVRTEIKLRADTICQGFVNQNGLYNYFNKCDAENNTQTLIDNQIGVLNTYVEIIKGMEVIVNQLTILRTGAISSSGFITQ